MRLAAALVLIATLTGPAFAVDPAERLAEPRLEERARLLSEELRCLVCQNQSIDASDAELAGDLRKLVRERISAGDSDAEVLDFLVERYGEFVLLRPRAHGAGLLLWALAPALLVVAAGGLLLAYRRRSARPVAEALTAEEEAALAALDSVGDERPNS